MKKWDKLLAYDTIKIVKIKDYRLGVLHHLFVFAIFIYIVVFNMVLDKNYLDRETPVGTVRLQLQAPSAKFRTRDPPYCGTNGTYYGDDGREFPRKPCWYMDEFFVVYPTTEASALFAATRVEQTPEIALPGCVPPVRPDCSWNTTGVDDIFFIPDIEWFTLYVDHSMNAPRLGFTRNAIDMSGSLVDSNGIPIDPCLFYTERNQTCPSYVSVGKQDSTDIVPLKALLAASEISLDTFSQSTGGNGTRDNYSRRYAGLVLLVQIIYDNTFTYNTGNIRYTYTVKEVSNTQFKAEEPQYNPSDPSIRVINNRHGIRIVVQQSGTIGAFSFQVSLIQLVSSLGLLALATVIVDLLGQFVFSNFRSFKIEEHDPSIAEDERTSLLVSPS